MFLISPENHDSPCFFFFIESALPSKEAHSIDDTISLFLFISMSHSCLFKERKSTRIAAFYIFAKMSEGRRSTFFYGHDRGELVANDGKVNFRNNALRVLLRM